MAASGMPEATGTASLIEPAEREHQAELHRRLVGIVELLHGLPVGAAEHLLKEAGRIMKTIVLVDASGPGFAELVRTYQTLFGDGGATTPRPN